MGDRQRAVKMLLGWLWELKARELVSRKRAVAMRRGHECVGVWEHILAHISFLKPV